MAIPSAGLAAFVNGGNIHNSYNKARTYQCRTAIGLVTRLLRLPSLVLTPRPSSSILVIEATDPSTPLLPTHTQVPQSNLEADRRSRPDAIVLKVLTGPKR